ncbi:MAG: adenylate/guanylate cyclase domain-containing protein [Magnetococcales bacterium]|nr:adenylate/guanylate cyclase domain-containing protein [Magnetococcales bacterium]MBF0113767.1 adenylate/guanylate cyclase domain-containing protein [Magnetococcales bacterium]
MKKLLGRYDLLIVILLFLLVIPAEKYEIFALLEEQTISFRHLLRQSKGQPAQTQFSKDAIVLVNTDEKFFKEYGSFPLRRTDVGKIAENLRTLGAKVVAIDLLMDFPSSYGEDVPTAESFKKAGNVMVVSQAEFRKGTFVKLNGATPVLAEVTQNGYTNIGSQSAIVTSLSRLKIYPAINEQVNAWPFAVKALAMFLDVEPKLENNVLKLGDQIAVPLDQFGNFYIDFPALPSGTKFLSQSAGLSALDFINIEKLDDDERMELSAWVKDKLVLLGDTSEVSHDWFDTPVGMVYGVEIIADSIHTLLRNAPLRPADDTLERNILLVTLGIILIASLFPSLAKRSLVLLLVLVGLVSFSSYFYIYQGLVISLSYNLTAIVLSYLVVSFYFYRQEMGQKQMIKGAFGQYLSPKVVEILCNDPSKLSLGGESREMTAYFSDVAGFSTISEKLTPEELVQLLNEYLTAMCEIISRYDGTVDKFEGDAIIAFWGAPLEQPDHAKLCCYACIDMNKHMVEMRERLLAEGRPKLTVRMGINTGRMVVGNMGSKQRMDYTIMGDAVNLAARLEGANKFYSSGTMISDSTYQQAKDFIEARELDIVRVVGKNEPVTIYQLLDRKGELDPKMAQILELYNHAREAYKAKDFATALQRFEKILAVDPNDGPGLTYVARCKEYLENPPPADWDGVFQFTSKG